MSLADRVGSWLADRTTRRSFLARSTLAATALSVGPVDFLLRPSSAYAFVCQCASGRCDCAQSCCDGYTDFCCTIGGGINACPPGSFAGGWWKADGSKYCAGPRYYIDCMADCHGCGCSTSLPFCVGCDGLVCECAQGSCANRHVGCTEFRYGQCHTEIGCSGRILCRVVSCTPPWQLDASCSTVTHTDDSTANHFSACLASPTHLGPPPVVGMAATSTGLGYWIVDQAGAVSVFGDATDYGNLTGQRLNRPIVAMAPTRSGQGYWLVAADGGVFCFGDAVFAGSTGDLVLNRPIVGMAPTRSGHGYWLVAADGGVFCFGDAVFAGSTGDLVLNRPVVGMAPDLATGGYWLVAADGGIFSFGGPFEGSTGSLRLNRPVVGMAATPGGGGYWLVAADGGIFSFGEAQFLGSTGSLRLNNPVVGMTATPTGQGYWLVAADGGIFTFGDARFFGSRPSA